MDHDAEIVDAGKKSFVLSFEVPTKGLRKGQSVARHITAEHIKDAALISDIDILNAKEIELESRSGAGDIGILVYHGPRGKLNPKTGLYEPLLLDTNEHVLHTEAAEGDVSATVTKYHVHEMDPVVKGKILPVNPSGERTELCRKLVQKRLDRRWRGFKDDNILAGVYKTDVGDIEGVPTHYLVTESDHATGLKSAVWNLLKKNEEHRHVFGGRYTKERLAKQSYTHKGKPAIQMTASDLEEAVLALRPTFKQHSPFAHGLGVAVTKTDDSVAEGNTLVRLKVHRNVFDRTAGLEAAETSTKVTLDDVALLNGGAKASKNLKKKSTAEAMPAELVAAGLDRYVSKKVKASDLAAALTITPASEVPELASLGLEPGE